MSFADKVPGRPTRLVGSALSATNLTVYHLSGLVGPLLGGLLFSRLDLAWSSTVVLAGLALLVVPTAIMLHRYHEPLEPAAK